MRAISSARAHAELGRFRSAKHLKEVGETYESIGREEEAIEAYGEAASAYEGRRARERRGTRVN